MLLQLLFRKIGANGFETMARILLRNKKGHYVVSALFGMALVILMRPNKKNIFIDSHQKNVSNEHSLEPASIDFVAFGKSS